MAEMEKEMKETPAEETPAEETPAEETVETAEEVVETNPWEEKYNAERDAHLRVAAEYDNFRKRSVKEKEGIYADAYADCIGAILPVIDNLERALQDAEGDKVVEGVRMTMNQFADSLQKLGVEVIETASFDPNYHNAVMHVEDEAYGEGEIVDVFQKGYKKGDKVIRYAMVKVAN